VSSDIYGPVMIVVAQPRRSAGQANDDVS
jgi:hypothetical protein